MKLWINNGLIKQRTLIALMAMIGLSPNALAIGLNIAGPIHSNSASVQGDVALSELEVSTLAVTDFQASVATTSVLGQVLQIQFSSSSTNTTNASTTPVVVSSLNTTISLTNSRNYVRISLSGTLDCQYTGWIPPGLVKLTIVRDATDLADGYSLLTTNNSAPAGIRIIDFPGDTGPHTYKVAISVSGGGTAGFTGNPIAFLILEEIGY